MRLKQPLILFLLAAVACMSGPAFLRAGSLEADSEKNAVLFDGASRSRAKAGKPPHAAGAAKDKDRERLAAQFKEQLTIDDHGDTAERAAIDSMISRMMESATAREMAAQFIKDDAKAVLSFEELPGSTVVTEEGEKTFWGPRGQTYLDGKPPKVQLNKLFLQYDRDTGIGTMSHELLGHALERQRGGDALRPVQYLHKNEEENARLIGWLVRTELDVKPADEIWAYVQNPDNYMESLKLQSLDYSITLTGEEMADPVPVYEKRLAEADKLLGRLSEVPNSCAIWTGLIDHLVSKHNMDPASFKTISDDINNTLASLPAQQKKVGVIKEGLQVRVAAFKTPAAKEFLEALAKVPDDDYFKRKDAVIKERRARLETLLLGRTRESVKTPPAPGQVTWKELSELRQREKSSCPFGGVK